jgi:nucleolar protein 9
MPRENRKRGKKHKKPQDETEDYSEPHAIATDSAALPEAQAEAGPSWIKTAATHSLEQEQEQLDSINRDAPFGEVDSDVKAYFRTVDIQMKQWMEEEPEEEDEDKDPNEGVFYRVRYVPF